MRKVAVSTAAVFALTTSLSACDLPFGSQGVPEIAAEVEGSQISSKEINDLFEIFAKSAQGEEAMSQTGQGLTVDDKTVRQTALTYQIRIVFLEALAKQRGVNVDATTADQEDIYKTLSESPSFASEGFRASDLQIAARAEALSKAIAAKIRPRSRSTPRSSRRPTRSARTSSARPSGPRPGSPSSTTRSPPRR
jgi:hypothetical protein